MTLKKIRDRLQWEDKGRRINYNLNRPFSTGRGHWWYNHETVPSREDNGEKR